MTNPKTISVSEATSFFTKKGEKPWEVVSIYRKAHKKELDVEWINKPVMRILVNERNKEALSNRRHGGKRIKTKK